VLDQAEAREFGTDPLLGPKSPEDGGHAVWNVYGIRPIDTPGKDVA
jgi:hypothetical protein